MKKSLLLCIIAAIGFGVAPISRRGSTFLAGMHRL